MFISIVSILTLSSWRGAGGAFENVFPTSVSQSVSQLAINFSTRNVVLMANGIWRWGVNHWGGKLIFLFFQHMRKHRKTYSNLVEAAVVMMRWLNHFVTLLVCLSAANGLHHLVWRVCPTSDCASSFLLHHGHVDEGWASDWSKRETLKWKWCRFNF